MNLFHEHLIITSITTYKEIKRNFKPLTNPPFKLQSLLQKDKPSTFMQLVTGALAEHTSQVTGKRIIKYRISNHKR